VPPVPAINGQRRHIDINIDEHDIEETIREAFERENDVVEENRDKMRELSERQRDLSWQQREFERSRRDLEFEKRNADGDRRKEIDKGLTELAGELKKLESKRIELEKFTKQLAAEQAKLAAEQEAAQKQLYNQSLAVFEETIGNMLCGYGAGLKSLPENENISFVISDFADAERDSVIRTHDKVYVFKYKDVKSCVTGKSNKEQLLANATTYLF
jgi:DNA repair exonuclease SbcCD ATPase subunit